MGKLLKDSGDPFGKDGRWVLTNGPDIAPLKGKIFKNRPFTTQQTMPVVIEGGHVEWKAPGTAKADSDVWTRIHTGVPTFINGNAN